MEVLLDLTPRQVQDLWAAHTGRNELPPDDPKLVREALVRLLGVSLTFPVLGTQVAPLSHRTVQEQHDGLPLDDLRPGLKVVILKWFMGPLMRNFMGSVLEIRVVSFPYTVVRILSSSDPKEINKDLIMDIRLVSFVRATREYIKIVTRTRSRDALVSDVKTSQTKEVKPPDGSGGPPSEEDDWYKKQKEQLQPPENPGN